jgi:hypothetical protein
MPWCFFTVMFYHQMNPEWKPSVSKSDTVFVICWVQHVDEAAIATLMVFKFLSCKNSSLCLKVFVEVGHHLLENKLCIGKD